MSHLNIKQNWKKYTVVLSLIIVLIFMAGSFSVIGSNTERVMNSKPIELHMYPESFNNYCGDGGASCTSAYRLVCNPYEYSRSASEEYNCQAWSIPGAERKLIGEFCTEKPILKIYSVTANMYFEDWFGAGTRPPIYLGTTDNKELSNKESTIAYTTVYSGTNYPLRDIGMNTDILTEYVKGTNCFDIYAVGGYYKKNSRSGMDATVNYIDINYDPIECNTNIDCDDQREDTIDTCFEYTCNHLDIATYEQIKTEAKSEVTLIGIITTTINNYILKINLWISGLL